MDNNLPILPDREEAARAVNLARMELIEAIVRREETLGPIARDAEARYAIVFGEALVQQAKLQVQEARMRRKLEKVRSLSLAEETIDMAAIELALDEEFAGEVLRISADTALRESATKRYKIESLFAAQRTEQARLFRDITAKMSPDVDLDIEEDKRQLFEEGRRAYRDGQVQNLQMIHFLSRQMPRRAIVGDRATLIEERMRLQERTREIKGETRLAMEQEPLSFLQIVDQDERVEQERKYLRHKAMELQQSIARYRRMIAEMLPG